MRTKVLYPPAELAARRHVQGIGLRDLVGIYRCVQKIYELLDAVSSIVFAAKMQNFEVILGTFIASQEGRKIARKIPPFALEFLDNHEVKEYRLTTELKVCWS